MAVPQGYSGSAAIAMVSIRTNEFTALTGQQILTLLNAGVEQVTAELGAVRLVAAYPTTTGQLFQVLNNDIADIYSCVSFQLAQSGSPRREYIVYPLQQIDRSLVHGYGCRFSGSRRGPAAMVSVGNGCQQCHNAADVPACDDWAVEHLLSRPTATLG